MKTTIYGISNCDTVRKARRWLEAVSVTFDFHDFRKDGLNTEQVAQWLDAIGIERLLNKRSTTWKTLCDDDKNRIETDPITLLTEHPTLIKRPVLVTDTLVEVGFKPPRYAEIFKEDTQ